MSDSLPDLNKLVETNQQLTAANTYLQRLLRSIAQQRNNALDAVTQLELTIQDLQEEVKQLRQSASSETAKP